MQLTALKVAKTNLPGMYCDGGGLYLRVTKEGAKNWVFRYMLNGRARWMGLGPVALYSLQEARKRALEARRLRHDGVDPIEARRRARRQQQLEEAKAVTFKECADSYIKAHRAGWRNAVHTNQWETTLATYAHPIIGALPVQAINIGLVVRILEPIWNLKPETASRLRGRIEAILDWAKVSGYRDGENPARWRGHLDKLLPRKSRVRKVKHHAALPYAEMPTFMEALRKQQGIAARVLEFTILTACRTGETRGATWNEVDLPNETWTIPAERMKKGDREHRVPLSARALAILEEMQRDTALIFPDQVGKPLSNMRLSRLLRRINRDVTAHGFRSTFRDWAAERTSFPNHVAEMALAHAIGNKVEAAYRRGDLFERRRELMNAWAAYCG